MLCSVTWRCGRLTLLRALLEAVVDLLEHGLAAPLEHRQHDALEGVFVRRLDRPLHRFGRRSPDGVRRVLREKARSER